MDALGIYFLFFFFLGTKERLEHSRGDVGRECGRFWVRSVGEGRVGKGSQGFFFFLSRLRFYV